MKSNVILLANPLTKNRSWDVGKASYKNETMFPELKKTFKVVKLEEVLHCSNEICRITKFIHTFVPNKDSTYSCLSV